MRICLLECLLRYLVNSLAFNGAIFEYKQCPPHLGIPMTWNHLESPTGTVGIAHIEKHVHDRMMHYRSWFIVLRAN